MYAIRLEHEPALLLSDIVGFEDLEDYEEIVGFDRRFATFLVCLFMRVGSRRFFFILPG